MTSDTATSAARVLVVDDERFFREAIRELLEGQGFAVTVARDAGEALEAAEDRAIGVVVLDIQLPDRSGLDVLRVLRERRPEVRVVMLSAHTDQEYVLEALRLGACDYLAKPLHDEELRLSVRRALESYELASGFAALRARLAGLAGEVERMLEGAEEEDASALASRLAEAAARLLDASKTSVLLYEPESDQLRVAAMTGRKDRPEDLDPVPMSGSAAGRAVAEARPIVVEDVAEDPRFAPAPADRYASDSFVVLPLGRGPHPIGALCATDRRGGERFREEDVTLLRLLAMALSPLLDPTRPLVEQRSRPLVDELGPLLDEPGAATDADGALARAVCEAMTAEVEPARVLGVALAATGERLDASLVSVFLLDVRSGQLRREAQWSRAGGADREQLPRGAGVTGAAFEEGRVIASAGPGADPQGQLGVDTPEDGAPGPLSVLPLRFRGKTLGVCRLFPEAGSGSPGAASAQTLELLATTLSAAVRNVLLYRSLVESIEEVAQVRREAAAGHRDG